LLVTRGSGDADLRPARQDLRHIVLSVPAAAGRGLLRPLTPRRGPGLRSRA
jgi:hypothetical protein